MSRDVGSARAVALEALRRIERDGAYANLVLPTLLDRSDLSARDRRFVTELVYGTTRMRRACDAIVDRFITAPPDDAARTLLRLGAYQLHFTDVPAHAAVAETVGLAPRRVRGFVNAVLRRASISEMTWPSTGARLSYPDWVIERLSDELGDADALAALETMNRAPSVTVRDDGYVQDLASQWVADAVGAGPGELIADVCAAPGGKATHLASQGAVIVATDTTFARVGLIASNSSRLGSGVHLAVADATRSPLAAGRFDAVLIDAPCSGLGTLRRRPDARWNLSPSDIADLIELQAAIIAASAALVRPGGRLVYSVCTLTAAESIEHRIPDGFAIDHEVPTGEVWQPYGHGWRVLPQHHDTDGMVLVRLRRQT